MSVLFEILFGLVVTVALLGATAILATFLAVVWLRLWDKLTTRRPSGS